MVNALRNPQGLHSDSTVHPSTLEELQYQSLLGPLWVRSNRSHDLSRSSALAAGADIAIFFLWLSLPVQRVADTRGLPSRGRHPDRHRPSRRHATRRA